jgi:hypothetical protein
MLRKRRYSELGDAGKAAVLVIAAVSLVIVATAERDIGQREADEVRGSRGLWRVVSLNALGAIAYLRFGRRRQEVADRRSARP